MLGRIEGRRRRGRQIRMVLVAKENRYQVDQVPSASNTGEKGYTWQGLGSISPFLAPNNLFILGEIPG